MGTTVSAASRMVGRILPRRLPSKATTTIVALMQPIRRRWMTGVLPIVGLITMLVVLAALQLHWSTTVSEAERDRLQQSLERSTEGFQASFAVDLLRICRTLQAAHTRAPQDVLDRLTYRYIVWRRMSGNTALISGFYIWPRSAGQPDSLLKLDPETLKLEPSAWPDSLRAFANQKSSRPRLPRVWIWDEQTPMLVHPIYALEKEGSTQRPKLFGYLLVTLDRKYFEEVYLPGLGRRYFPPSNGFIFQLVENQGNQRHRVVYQSGGSAQTSVFEHADRSIDLLEETALYHAGQKPGSPGPVLLPASDTSVWQLVVRHRSGSVDAAVSSLRRRNLAVSMVVLLVLAVSLITILFSTRRARKFAQLQMEFASGVSHELRTPLAVICSAAENLADGVVAEAGPVRDYGVLIHQEGQRLSRMVDHILEFARLRASPEDHRLQAVPVNDVIEGVLKNIEGTIQSAGISLELQIPDCVPLLFTDAATLSQCLQNLLSNAVKYGSDGKRILLEVSEAQEDGQERVLICVQDFGPGIPPDELALIWNPFFRGSSARDSQIHGTGLGLSLTREMMQALGGRITVASTLGKGSLFILHVPVATGEAAAPEASPASSSG